MRQISRRRGGFTLIELMIVVVVIAILSAIAFPTYQNQVRKGKRAEGRAKLVAAAQRLERSYSDNNTYACTNPPAPASPTCSGTLDLAPLFGLGAGSTVYSGNNNDPGQSAYTLSMVAGTGGIASSYLLTATPAGQFTDTDCGSLGLDNLGKKWIHEESTPSSSTGSCWQ